MHQTSIAFVFAFVILITLFALSIYQIVSVFRTKAAFDNNDFAAAQHYFQPVFVITCILLGITVLQICTSMFGVTAYQKLNEFI
jgi:ABC-type dipeptide/oligopeptide/nickel transport system permease component